MNGATILSIIPFFQMVSLEIFRERFKKIQHDQQQGSTAAVLLVPPIFTAADDKQISSDDVPQDE
eukprot:IDg20749t1